MTRSLRLRTERFTLRPIAEADFETFYRLLVLDPEVIAYYFAYRAPLTDAERRARARRDFFRGLVTEAARAVIPDAFARHGLEALHAVVDPPNWPSRRVLERLGFRHEGPVRVYGADHMAL